MFSSVRLQNFRSYKDSRFDLSAEVNVVFGPNASGKTNLLEGLLVLARGKSYRNKMPQLVMRGKKWARLDGKTGQTDRVLKIQDNTEFSIDNKTYKRLPTSQQLPVVLFEPNHLLLLTGEPSKRRDWMDSVLEQKTPAYKKNLANYNRVLAQRNSLLKKPLPAVRKQIFAWDIRLSELASFLASSRQELANDINDRINKPYQHLSDSNQQSSIKYLPTFPVKNYSSHMLRRLDQDLETDTLRGFTSTGPHREDFATSLNNRPITEAGSRGEVRSLLVSLKLLEKDWLEETTEIKPILLLDDVFSELDSQRRKALVDYLVDHQTIITTTDADLTHKYFKESQLINLG